MLHRTVDLRVEGLRPLIPPAILMEELPIDDVRSAAVEASRAEVTDILAGRDGRLLVVVGPCSIHDPAAGVAYAERLAALEPQVRASLCLVMRVYFEKPRTTVGWKGLVNDPHLDGTFAINTGLRTARRFLLDVVGLGIPAGTELLDPITPQFVADLLAWGAIGARTTESQVHRELASGLSMPVGFKNGTGGSISIAIDAVRAARHPHHFLGVTKHGLAAIVATRGNPSCHVILRGGTPGPNCDPTSVGAACDALRHADLVPSVMVDCSHANSGRNPARQEQIAHELAARIASGEPGVSGVMLESFLVDGRQDRPEVFGQSITDPCMGWDRTVGVLEALANAVARRSRVVIDPEPGEGGTTQTP